MPQITELDVQLWTLYTTAVIALIGFVFNVISLWQTKRATEDMSKPFINIYVDRYAVKSQEKMYVIKNFGQTPAYIDKIELIDGELDELNKKRLFQSLVGNMLAPNQRLTSAIHPDFNSLCFHIFPLSALSAFFFGHFLDLDYIIIRFKTDVKH